IGDAAMDCLTAAIQSIPGLTVIVDDRQPRTPCVAGVDLLLFRSEADDLSLEDLRLRYLTKAGENLAAMIAKRANGNTVAVCDHPELPIREGVEPKSVLVQKGSVTMRCTVFLDDRDGMESMAGLSFDIKYGVVE